MRNILIYIGLVVFILSCGQKRELVKNTWIVIDGTFMGRPIEFHSTDLLKFTDRTGSEIKNLNFSKDQTIVLPGINSPNISARWVIEDDKVRFSVDSIRYSIYSTIDSDLSFLDTS